MRNPEIVDKMSTFFTALAVALLLQAFASAAPPDISNVVLTPGRTESEQNFVWQTHGKSVAEAVVQIALKSDMTGADFPEDKALTFTGKSADFEDGFASHKVTVSGLATSTGYTYRLGIGPTGEWSDVYEFSTRVREAYTVLLIGDAQIGAKNIDQDTAGLRDTLDKALQKAPDAAFILSAGDQVNTGSSRDEYDGLLSLPHFKSLPFVPTIGNHDNHELFSYHFNVPNESLAHGKTPAGGNYYFVYGNTLFVVINSNSRNFDQHAAFIRDAVKKHGQSRWKIAMMHHSIYGSDIPRSATIELRENLYTVFDKYGMDIVLSGHDHIYVRTHFMRKNQVVHPLEKFPARSTPPIEIPAGAVIKPKATLYLAAASSSGSKYYDPASQSFYYLAERLAPYVPMFSQINITNTSLEIISYRTDTMAAADSFAMVKTGEKGLHPLLIITLIGGGSAAVLIAIRLRMR